MARMILGSRWGELRFEVEQIDVTSSLPYPDEKWSYIDQHGHEHHWQDGYPTLRWVVDEPGYIDEDGEEYPESGHYECPQDGEQIRPGTRVDTYRRYAPGRRSYFLDDEPISEERFLEVREEMRRDAEGR